MWSPSKDDEDEAELWRDSCVAATCSRVGGEGEGVLALGLTPAAGVGVVAKDLSWGVKWDGAISYAVPFAPLNSD